MTFYKWFEEKFCCTQTEDSPYCFDDVKEAYETGKNEYKHKIKDAITTLIWDDEDTVWEDTDTPDGAYISADKLLKLLGL